MQTAMYLAGFCLAVYREARDREAEGYHVRYSDCATFHRLCKYADDPKQKLLEQLPEPCREFVVWRDMWY